MNPDPLSWGTRVLASGEWVFQNLVGAGVHIDKGAEDTVAGGLGSLCSLSSQGAVIERTTDDAALASCDRRCR